MINAVWRRNSSFFWSYDKHNICGQVVELLEGTLGDYISGA